MDFVAGIPEALTKWVWMWGLVSLCVGSFLSVVVTRMPLILQAYEEGREPDISLSRPRSRCAACGKPLKFWQNIPLLGYVLFGRSAPCCGARVPFRYLALELAALAWGLAAWFTFEGQWLSIVAWSTFGWFLLAGAVMDFQTRWLPDNITIGLMWTGLLFSAAQGKEALPVHLWTVAVTYALIAGAAAVVSKLKNQPALGGGDVLLLSALGAWLSPGHLALTLVFASLAQAVLMAAQKKSCMAFGPAIALSAAAVAVLGWYRLIPLP